MTQRVIHTFEPVCDCHSKILILGTIPSVKSREVQCYYGNPRNRFYKVLGTLLHCEFPNDIAGKKKMLLKNGIALFDVLRSCDIHASADASIRNPQANDFSKIFDAAQIHMVFANGKKAYELYQRHCLPVTRRECICLPSTSPANAAADMDKLLASWAQILDYL